MSDKETDIDFAALRELRDQLDAVDSALVTTMSERQRLVAEIGALKSARGHGTRDFKRERAVLDKVRTAAQEVGIDGELASEVLKLLIRASLQSQEQARVRAEGSGGGQHVLIVGGAGRMGRWLQDFFHSQGYATSIADPAVDSGSPGNFRDLQSAGVDYDIIVVATTLTRSAAVLDELAILKPRGLVFDIGSLKTPLRDGLEKLVTLGVRVTSLHPMFGPDTQLLAGKHVVFVDVGDSAATDQAKTLFAATMATCVDMDIDQHDRVIADVLGLSHATSIAFAASIAASDSVTHGLVGMTSPTFDAQLTTATKVVHENPDLYFEIQSLNRFGIDALDRLLTSVTALRDAVRDGEHDAFVRTMTHSRDFLDRELG